MFVDTSLRPQGEQIDAVAPKLKLSAAIRIGARLRPQVKGMYLVAAGSCALGAAWEGSTGDANWYCGDIDGRDSIVEMQLKFGIPDEMIPAIQGRNDSGQSRESIADWLEAQGL